MNSTVLAYAFIRNAFNENSGNVLTSIFPIIKRALMEQKNRKIDTKEIQANIKRYFGIEIPLSVIRYSFPYLARDGVLTLSENFVYEIVNPNFKDSHIVELEEKSKIEYSYLLDSIDKLLMAANPEQFSDKSVFQVGADYILEHWLDDSAISFIGKKTSILAANFIDRDINKVIFQCIDADASGKFLEYLTNVAVGDCIFVAVKAVTQYENELPENFEFPSRMENVKVFFDTRFVLRSIGIGLPDLCAGAKEVLELSVRNGCKICVFDHTVVELSGIIRNASFRLRREFSAEDDVAQYARENNLQADDLLDLAINVVVELDKFGYSIEDVVIQEKIYIDEDKLETFIQKYVLQESLAARRADVKSIVKTFGLRNNEPRKFLEKSEAVFVTTNKALENASNMFFREHFREEEVSNRSQVCMTDVVFGTRMWTKLPTATYKVPRQQIISHIMANLRPTQRLVENFEKWIKIFEEKGKISGEDAIRVKLARFVNMALAEDYAPNKVELSSNEFVTTYNKVLKKEKEYLKKLVSAESSKEAKRIFEEYKSSIDAEPDKVNNQVLVQVGGMQNIIGVREKIEVPIRRIVNYSIYFVILISFLVLLRPIVAIYLPANYASLSHVSMEIVVVTINVLLAFLTFVGMSAVGLKEWLVEKLTKRLVGYLFR